MWWWIGLTAAYFIIVACQTFECRTVCLPQDENCKRVCKSAEEWR